MFSIHIKPFLKRAGIRSRHLTVFQAVHLIMDRLLITMSIKGGGGGSTKKKEIIK